MTTPFIEREISDFAFSQSWVGHSMLFIAGPRQCGKTRLGREFLSKMGCPSLYFNWDIEKTRKQYRNDPDFMFREASKSGLRKPYVLIDEIHKATRWKNILKGFFDEHGETARIIVTGSARLDMFRRSGDSLAGRHILANLFPLSFREWLEIIDGPRPWLHEEKDWDDFSSSFREKLLETAPAPPDMAEAYHTFGPFPAPLVSGNMRRSRKWHADYISLLVREDLRDMSGIRELDRVARLAELLPPRIGSPISLRSLGEDLEANHSTVKNWLIALERLYLIWSLKPCAMKLQRAMKKEPKWYFLDWTYAESEGGRFENMIATSLFRFFTSLADRGFPKLRLCFFRTYDKKEIDFILFRNNRPILAVEAKTGARQIPPQLRRFRSNWENPFPVVQVVARPGVLLEKNPGEFIAGYDRLLAIL